MAYSENQKRLAINLRTKGFSIPIIAEKIKVSKSTASLWVRDITLQPALRRQLEKNSANGRIKGWEVQRERRKQRTTIIDQEAKALDDKLLSNIILDQ